MHHFLLRVVSLGVIVSDSLLEHHMFRMTNDSRLWEAS